MVHSLIDAGGGVGGEGISGSLGNHFCIFFSLSTARTLFPCTVLVNTAVLMLSLLVTLDAIMLAEAFNIF